jgi:multidrug efflux pump subunit AcrB
VNLYKWFIYNSVSTNILVVIILIAGIFCAGMINAELFPELELEMVVVSVIYPGATPAEVEEGICRKIEDVVRDVEGVKEMSSTSSEGVGSVVLEIERNEDVLVVKERIKSQIDQIRTFPEESEEPMVREITIKSHVINIALFGDMSYPALKEMSRQIEDELRNRGIGTDIVVQGLKDYEIAIEVSEESLRKYSLTFSDIARAVRSSSLDMPGGTIKTSSGEILVRTIGQRYSGAEYENIIVKALPDGSKLRVKDIAKVNDGFEDIEITGLYNGKPAAIIGVYKSEAQDSIREAKKVKAYVQERIKTLPAGFHMECFSDTSRFVSDRLELLLRNAMQGLVLVFIVLSVFLDLRLAFWVAAGIPVSFMGTIAIMYLLGQTLNMISMFALIMALGIIVDDAIVVGESIYTKMREGLAPKKAAIQGLQEMLWPVIGSVTTTIVAFMPMMNMPGVMGKMIVALPIAMISALVISLLEAIFILPCHLAHNVNIQSKNIIFSGLSRLSNFVEEKLYYIVDNYYTPLLKRATKFRYVTICFGFVFLLLSFSLYLSGRVKFTFFPKMDSEGLTASLVFPQGHPYDETHKSAMHILGCAEKLNKVFEKDMTPGHKLVKNTYTTVGQQTSRRGGASRGSHLALITMEIAGVDHRSVGSEVILNKWRELIGPVPGVEKLEIAAFQGGPPGKPISLELSGLEISKLEKAAEYLKEKIALYPGVYEIEDDLSPGKLEARLFFKKQARNLGLTLSDLAQQIRQAFYGAESNRIQRGRDEIKVMIRYPENQRVSIEDIMNMRVRTAYNQEIPFHEVADVVIKRGYSTIKRTEAGQAVIVSADVDTAQANARNILTDLSKKHFDSLFALYPGLNIKFTGKEQDTMESMDALKLGFTLVFLVIFGILATMFKSYTQPFVICFAIPLGFAGAIIGHYIAGVDIAMMSLFGMVALAGIVVNNSIILIDFIKIKIEQGISTYDAVIQSGRARFRPIIITTLTTIAGLAPMMLESSFQAQFLIPMAVSISYGLAFSTFLTLLFTPSMVMIFHDIRCFFSWLFTGAWQDRTVDELREDALEMQQ